MMIKEYEAIVRRIEAGDANAVKDILQFVSKILLSIWGNVQLGDYDQDVDAASCLSDRLLEAWILETSWFLLDARIRNGVNNEN